MRKLCQPGYQHGETEPLNKRTIKHLIAFGRDREKNYLMSVVPAQHMRLDVWAVMMRPVIIIMAHSYI